MLGLPSQGWRIIPPPCHNARAGATFHHRRSGLRRSPAGYGCFWPTRDAVDAHRSDVDEEREPGFGRVRAEERAVEFADGASGPVEGTPEYCGVPLVIAPVPLKVAEVLVGAAADRLGADQVQQQVDVAAAEVDPKRAGRVPVEELIVLRGR